MGVSLLVGLALALGAARSLARVVFGGTSSDPVTLLLVVGALGIVAFLASFIPAARARAVCPLVALREE